MNDIKLALRELADKIDKSDDAIIHAQSDRGQINYEEQIRVMIKTYPEIWGKGGSMRAWLERKCSEVGLAIDEDLEQWNLPEEK